MEKRVSSPSAFKTANRSIALTVSPIRAYFQGLSCFYSRMPDQVSSSPAHPTPEAVRGILAGVIDPELHASIVELDMVRDVEVDAAGNVSVTVALTTAGCPLRGQIGNDVRSKVAGLPGVNDVKVEYGEMTQEQ